MSNLRPLPGSSDRDDPFLRPGPYPHVIRKPRGPLMHSRLKRRSRKFTIATAIAAVAAIVTSGCGVNSQEAPRAVPAPDSNVTAPTTSQSMTSSSATAEPATETQGDDGPVGDRRRIINVIDGDTVDVAGGNRVRVLGIDSCESGTVGGGKATAEARKVLQGQTVTLVREPGVSTGGYGRDLRYVYVPSLGGDYGVHMARFDHTGPYEGGDASPEYMTQIRNAGPARSCGGDQERDNNRDNERTQAPAPKPAPKPKPAPEPEEPTGGSAYYRNCDAARAAGAAPVRRGDPGYSSKLDRDGDGVGCE